MTLYSSHRSHLQLPSPFLLPTTALSANGSPRRPVHVLLVTSLQYMHRHLCTCSTSVRLRIDEGYAPRCVTLINPCSLNRSNRTITRSYKQWQLYAAPPPSSSSSCCCRCPAATSNELRVRLTERILHHGTTNGPFPPTAPKRPKQGQGGAISGPFGRFVGPAPPPTLPAAPSCRLKRGEGMGGQRSP